MRTATLVSLKSSVGRLAVALHKAWHAIVHYQRVWLRGEGTALAYPDFPDDHWTRDDTWAAEAEGWNIYDAFGVLEIERNDDNDIENVPRFPSAAAALTFVSRCAAEGS